MAELTLIQSLSFSHFLIGSSVQLRWESLFIFWRWLRNTNFWELATKEMTGGQTPTLRSRWTTPLEWQWLTDWEEEEKVKRCCNRVDQVESKAGRTYLKDLLNTMWGISFWIELASHDILKKLSPSHPAQLEFRKYVRFSKILVNTKKNIDIWTTPQLTYRERIRKLLIPSRKWIYMKVKQNAFGNFHVLFRSTCTLRGYGNTVPPQIPNFGSSLQCVWGLGYVGVNFYESPQTHSQHSWWALTLTNDPTPQPSNSTCCSW